MTILATRMAATQPSATKAMTARAAALRAQGRDVVIVSQGEPDFDTPDNVREAGIRAIREGRTHYTPVAGVAELRNAICDKLKRDNGLSYAVDEIIVGCGAKQVIFGALLATLDAGDEVIIPSPCWVSYPEMVRIAGGVARIVDCAAAPGVKLDAAALEAAITTRTKWLILNSPNNPTGSVYSAAELGALAAVLRRHEQVWVLCDDIYEKLVYAPARFATMAQVAPDLADRVLLVNGLSKASAMTGWRIGYGAGPQNLIKAMIVLQGQTISHTSSIAQHAAIEALIGCQDHVGSFARIFERRRDFMLAALAAAPGLDCSAPDGAFYLFPSIRRLLGRSITGGAPIDSDVAFTTYLLEEAGVAVMPGSSFLAPGFLRISYASSEEDLDRACARIVRACERLK